MRNHILTLKMFRANLNTIKSWNFRFDLNMSIVKYLLILMLLMVFISGYAALGQSLSFEDTLEKMMDIAGVKPGMIIGKIGRREGPLAFLFAERVSELRRI